MHEDDDILYYRRREQQELKTAQTLTDPLAARLHWEMAQQYATRARLREEAQAYLESEGKDWRPRQDSNLRPFA